MRLNSNLTVERELLLAAVELKWAVVGTNAGAELLVGAKVGLVEVTVVTMELCDWIFSGFVCRSSPL